MFVFARVRAGAEIEPPIVVHMLLFAVVVFLAAYVVPAGAYVIPAGPFCPFRSAACADGGFLGDAMSELTTSKMPQFAVEMSRLELEMQSGATPDLDRVRKMAGDLSDAEAEWRTMLTRMRLVDDFQSREYLDRATHDAQLPD